MLWSKNDNLNNNGKRLIQNFKLSNLSNQKLTI